MQAITADQPVDRDDGSVAVEFKHQSVARDAPVRDALPGLDRDMRVVLYAFTQGALKVGPQSQKKRRAETVLGMTPERQSSQDRAVPSAPDTKRKRRDRIALDPCQNPKTTQRRVGVGRKLKPRPNLRQNGRSLED